MPWRLILRMRPPDPRASARADAVTQRLGVLTEDLQESVGRLSDLADRLEGLGDDDPDP